MQLNFKEFHWFALGCICSVGNGAMQPLIGIFMSKMIEVLSLKDSPTFRSDSDYWSLRLFIIAIAAFVSNTGQNYFFSMVAEALTLRLRRDCYKKIVKLPMSYFDMPENGPGNISSRLAQDTQTVNTLTSAVIGTLIQHLSTICVALIIAFICCWQLTLVGLGCFPVMIFSGMVRARRAKGFSDQTDEAYKESGNLISEAVTNIRTVQSFGNTEKLLSIFDKKLEEPQALAAKMGLDAGLSSGVSQALMFGVQALVFYVGTLFYRSLDISISDMFISIFAIMFAGMAIGQKNQFMGDIGITLSAGQSIFNILLEKDEVQLEGEFHSKRLTTPVRGDIELRNITFKYPSREKIVSKNLNLTIKAGQRVALVGPSGCGKSTIMGLLQRFYTPMEGEILLDGIDIRHYDLSFLRSQFGVVSQEPTLFNGTIGENIRYNSYDATQEEIEYAAEKANAMRFIMSSKEEAGGDENKRQQGVGFEKNVGAKGGQISGGQKQRVAIARAILKKPNILLLDEATSALDTESEIVVQDSLNKIMEGKTSISIAHRISTIADSDCIFVFEDGQIVERGNYAELMALKGYFYRLERGEPGKKN